MKSLISLSLLAAFGAAHAQILLTVDYSNPLVTTIFATDGLAALSSSGDSFRIRLRDFFTSGVSGAGGLAGDLRTATGSYTYNQAFPGLTDSRSLLFFQGSGGITQTFVAGQRAFLGSGTKNLSGFSAQLRTTTFVGDIEILNGFNNPTGQIVGQYATTAVPEPATMTALALGAAALLRRRKKSA